MKAFLFTFALILFSIGPVRAFDLSDQDANPATETAADVDAARPHGGGNHGGGNHGGHHGGGGNHGGNHGGHHGGGGHGGGWPHGFVCYAEDVYRRVYQAFGVDPRFTQGQALRNCFEFSGQNCRALGCQWQ